MSKREKKRIWWLLAVLAICLWLLGMAWSSQRNTDQLTVTFFDVGQGDSALIQTPSHQNILIDAGPDTTVLSKIGQTLPYYDQTIDLIILTHGHSDHAMGLAEVLKRYKVGRVVWSGVSSPAPDLNARQDIAVSRHIPVVAARAGQSYSFGSVQLKILFPVDDSVNGKTGDLNSTSVVSRLTYENTSFLFTGDAPAAVENTILQEHEDVLSDVLKVGHHGSRYSSSEEFLTAVHPQYAVISVGAGNSYGHPHLSTLRRLEQAGVDIFRTDEAGDIKCRSDGQNAVCN